MNQGSCARHETGYEVMSKRLLILMLILFGSLSVVAQDSYYMGKAKDYMRNAEYYTKKAEGYDREAEYTTIRRHKAICVKPTIIHEIKSMIRQTPIAVGQTKRQTKPELK